MATGSKVLSKMLDRLMAGLMSGPNMNCRPRKSRQRIDLMQLAKLQDIKPDGILLALLGTEKKARIEAKVKAPRKSKNEDDAPTPGEKAWIDQTALLSKLRVIADDARTYENDTGVHALSIGFPLLSLPPGSFTSGPRGSTKRILAPIAFIPVTLSCKGGATPSVEFACREEGADRVTPNSALLSWIEQQTGKPSATDLFEDEDGADPWREVSELVKRVADAMRIEAPILPRSGRPEGAPSEQPPTELPDEKTVDQSTTDQSVEPVDTLADPREPEPEKPMGDPPILRSAPTADDESTEPTILLSAVLGLFPTAHQGLLRDTRAMIDEPALPLGPIQNFLTSGIDFDAPTAAPTPAPQPTKIRSVADEKLAAAADPCQGKAVALARTAAGLVVHGPPGTGKSQTITNIISDHLARGQRVLLVCEKRTALDVVADRLEHMGLGKLCGIVHDPQRDQRELYKSVHEQLADLPEAKLHPKAEAELAGVDEELQQLHDELTGHHQALMEPTAAAGPSFHELMGRWMGFQTESPVRVDDAHITAISVDQLQKSEPALNELFERAAQVEYFKNPWTKCAGVALADYLSRPMSVARTAMSRILTAASAADATADPRIEPFNNHVPVQRQAAARAELANQLTEAMPHAVNAGLANMAVPPLAFLQSFSKQVLVDSAEHLRTFRAGPLDPEFKRKIEPAIPQLMRDSHPLRRDILFLQQYLEIAGRWFGLFAFKIRSQAATVLRSLGLPRTVFDARRATDFLMGLQARLVLSPDKNELASDERIAAYFECAAEWLPLLEKIATDPALAGVGPALAKVDFSPQTPTPQLPFSGGPEGRVDDATAIESPTLRAAAKQGLISSEDFLQGLRLSTARADAIVRLEDELNHSMLFSQDWLTTFAASIRANKLANETAVALNDHLDQLEGVLRVRAGRANLPPELGPAADQILAQLAAVEDAIAAIQQKVLTAEITRRLRENPALQNIDGHRIDASFDRFRELEERKKSLVRNVILHQWTTKQQERLLVGTGTRLNNAGADLRRRMTSRGENAKRLRQVIAMGLNIDGGDPLFDLCPVWMASPETVAQIFPRSPLFDVVVFDEASQCRLEEALPVLTRGKRVVIAGDPHQLPPTRFFESGLVQSEDEDPQTEQELFETQQGEIEDLLGAALNLSIQQCYLDVHYRSRNADLIEFSNRNFYASRLQAIPGHPSNRPQFSPLTLYRAEGVYAKRRNEAEADRVVQIVQDLLKRADPPSIGIACLNLPQRDLITEKLDDLAAEDSAFGKRLAAARQRKGEGSFEGLFVKNLENVQGDERDDIIISTTYGPDTNGKFYRRFGPLGMSGGGRRLNVLVTRARREVHLVTSIPAEAYRSLPAVPEGQSATGAWLLFAYLKYAEELASAYEGNVQRSTLNVQHSSEETAVVNVLPSKSPSLFSQSLGKTLAGSPRIGSDVHWGNDGFCVDLALHHPTRPGDVTIGVLCDGCRYTGADDAVEWDIFRTGILSAQGWQLQRIWTPHFFRDPQGNVGKVEKASKDFVANEKPADAIAAT